MLTGRSVTGVLHMRNQTLADWYSKRQTNAETAIFGSEFTATQITVDQSWTYKQLYGILWFHFIIKDTFLEMSRQ
jgi:hypothetical protein